MTEVSNTPEPREPSEERDSLGKTDTVARVLSILSLFVSAFGLLFTLINNNVTSLPQVASWWDRSPEGLTFNLQNNGQGPAHITEYSVHVSGHRFDHLSSAINITPELSQFFWDGIYWVDIGPGYTLRSGLQIKLLEVYSEMIPEKDRKVVTDILHDTFYVNAVICSAYGECYRKCLFAGDSDAESAIDCTEERVSSFWGGLIETVVRTF